VERASGQRDRQKALLVGWHRKGGLRVDHAGHPLLSGDYRTRVPCVAGCLGHLQYAKIVAKIVHMIERIPELRTLSPGDKLALVTELWDDLASNPEDIPITPAQIAEIERRLEEYRQNPDLGSTWEEVKARILGQNR
jgi:putative addiction module component (TIGR02574 family)